ncbi:MAG: beta-lactamase family protein, partial [Opitutaceae bacterium]|nr:beta-lactamase family protein [Opitutaceae bacterium]
RELIRKEIAEHALPSAAVAVVSGGTIEWAEGFGWADREKRVPATEHTPYSLASISKPITATALMVLVQAGKIGLDRPIDDYLGGARITARLGEAAQATVRRVANHSSGLPLHYQFFFVDEPHRRPPMEETIRRYANLVTAPGERYQYSNLGYGLLDHAIARVSGVGYVEFMRREVFVPLGMTRTSVDIGPGLEAFAAARYGTDGRPLPFYDFDHPGASAVFSSAHDLARFALFHLKARLPDQKAILSDASLDEMHRPTQPTGRTSGYGVGFGTAELAGGYRMLGHTGGMGGVNTVLRIFPQEGLAIIVLCNARTALPGRVADEIQRLKLPRWQRPAAQPTAPPRKFAPPAGLVGKWEGKVQTYAGERALTLEVRADGEIVAHVARQFRTLVNNAALDDGYLVGDFFGELGTEDTSRNHSHLSLSLKQRGDVLNGAVIAKSRVDPRAGNALSHWAELRRATAASAGVNALERAIADARALVTRDLAPKVPGLSVAVGVDGKVVWSEGFGYADLAARRPVTPATRFRIGSISKPIAAAGLMRLVEQGRFDLDAPVQRYVPDFPKKDGAPITGRLLAGHLGGIRHYRGDETLLNRPFPNVRAGLTLFEHEPLEAPPGTKYIYSTYGWNLLSAMMEGAAGEEFLRFMQSAVFDPLGLAQTRADRAGVVDPERTEFYEGAPGAFRVAPPVDSSYKWAGGGFLSTPEDLLRFGFAHLAPGFLRAESLAALFTSQQTSDGKPTDYGIGWRVQRDAHGHRVMLHTGSSIGGNSVLLLHPETRTVVAMVGNLSRSSFTKEAYEAVAELFAPVFAEAAARR